MQPSLKDAFQYINKIFERGLQDEYLTRSIEKITEYEKEKTSQEVRLLEKELQQYEGKYQMSSEVFFDRFDKGELGDKDDYFEWSALFQMYKKKMERLRILEGASD